jgi:hypothetical protein
MGRISMGMVNLTRSATITHRVEIAASFSSHHTLSLVASAAMRGRHGVAHKTKKIALFVESNGRATLLSRKVSRYACDGPLAPPQ